ncbi:MAG: M43 family zinc metalloprotease, partial [Bacteroidota bacterium]|nr:M43 family zinc metalloprotease [Bacteroidota bacterium]
MNKDKFPKFNLSSNASFRSSNFDDFIIIPVVVHVIYDGQHENLSDERVRSQIQVLNEDFGHYGKYNNDDRGKDTKIRFCLAKKDPDGNPTTGINHIKSELTELDSENEMLTKNLSRWDQKRFLNIWVVKSIDALENVQGYSYVPDDSGGPLFEGDGIVITFQFFGKKSDNPYGYNIGRTTTHEVGHYLNLIHPWGGDETGEGGCDDDDGIEDTPVCSLQFYSDYPLCEHPVQCDNTRLIEDFMDYSTDGCMKLFTADQGKAMINAIKKYRPILVSYENIVERGCVNFFDSLNNNTIVDVYPVPARTILNFETHSMDPYTLSFYIYDITGKLVLTKNIEGVTKGVISFNIAELLPGIYILKGSFADYKIEEKIIKTG